MHLGRRANRFDPIDLPPHGLVRVSELFLSLTRGKKNMTTSVEKAAGDDVMPGSPRIYKQIFVPSVSRRWEKGPPRIVHHL